MNYENTSPVNGTASAGQLNINDVRIILNKNDRFEFELKLKEIYGIKKELLKILFKMLGSPHSEQLTEALEEYYIITHRQVKCLHDIFDSLHIKVTTKRHTQVTDVFENVRKKLDQTGRGIERDAAIIAAIRTTESIEIAALESLSDLARKLHEENVETLLEQVLFEDKMVDVGFAQILEWSINPLSSN